MDAVVERLRLYDCRTTEDTQIRLNLEKTSLDFDEIYLLDDNGTMYTASFIIQMQMRRYSSVSGTIPNVCPSDKRQAQQTC